MTAVDADREYIGRALAGLIDTPDAHHLAAVAQAQHAAGLLPDNLVEVLVGGNRRMPKADYPDRYKVVDLEPAPVDVDPDTDAYLRGLMDGRRVPNEPDEQGDTAPDALSPLATPSDLGEHAHGDRSDSGDTRVRRTAWSAAELMATEFPDPRWAVPGIIAEGVNLLAGPPKCGKSWLALGLGVAVASGGKALGRVDVDEGPALVLALEDTPRRLKSRLGKILAGDRAPTGLDIAVEWEALPAGGDERIAAWLDRHPDARMVVIDVFAKVRGTAVRDVAQYDADYAAMTRAKAIADGYGVAVVVLHHTRKMHDDDFVATVSGTQGLAGASDAIAVLKRMRGKADGVLSITGRDVDEAEYALRFASDIGAWQLTETPVAEVRMGETKLTIVKFLRDNEGVGPKAIADGTGLDPNLVKQTVRRMARDSDLDSDGHGRYWVPVTAVTAVTIPGQGTDPGVTPVSLPIDEGEW